MSAALISSETAVSGTALRTLGRRLFDWSRQPSTQAGLSLFLGGCVLAWAHPFPAAEGIAATVIAASLPKLWPDNTTDAIRNQALSTAIAHAAVTRSAADLERLAQTAIEATVPVKS